MIFKKTITIATLSLIGLTSADSMQRAAQNFSRGRCGLVRYHTDVDPRMLPGIREYNSFYKDAFNVINTCVPGMKTINDPILIEYAQEYTERVRFVKKHLNPHPSADLPKLDVKLLMRNMKDTEAKLRGRLSTLEEHNELASAMGCPTTNFEAPMFILALESMEVLTGTLAEHPFYRSLSAKSEDPTAIE